MPISSYLILAHHSRWFLISLATFVCAHIFPVGVGRLVEVEDDPHDVARVYCPSPPPMDLTWARRPPQGTPAGTIGGRADC